MKSTWIVVMLLVAVASSMGNPLMNAENLEHQRQARFINWGEINIGCTFSCFRWNACVVKNWDNPGNCGASPPSCTCDTFAG